MSAVRHTTGSGRCPSSAARTGLLLSFEPGTPTWRCLFVPFPAFLGPERAHSLGLQVFLVFQRLGDVLARRGPSVAKCLEDGDLRRAALPARLIWGDRKSCGWVSSLSGPFKAATEDNSSSRLLAGHAKDRFPCSADDSLPFPAVVILTGGGENQPFAPWMGGPPLPTLRFAKAPFFPPAETEGQPTSAVSRLALNPGRHLGIVRLFSDFGSWKGEKDQNGMFGGACATGCSKTSVG